jgi:hypothetical protein
MMSEYTNNNEVIEEEKKEEVVEEVITPAPIKKDEKEEIEIVKEEEENPELKDLKKRLSIVDNQLEKLKKSILTYKKERKILEKEIEFVTMKLKLKKLEEEKRNWENLNKGN